MRPTEGSGLAADGAAHNAWAITGRTTFRLTTSGMESPPC